MGLMISQYCFILVRPTKFVLFHTQAEFLILGSNFTNACYLYVISTNFSFFSTKQADGLLIGKKKTKPEFLLFCSQREAIKKKKLPQALR